MLLVVVFFNSDSVSRVNIRVEGVLFSVSGFVYSVYSYLRNSFLIVD